MLLVHDGDRQVGEVHALLDQRVRADGNRRLAGRERGIGRAPLPRRLRAGEQHRADAKVGAEVGKREEVLLGERLRRRHERALAAALDGAQARRGRRRSSRHRHRLVTVVAWERLVRGRRRARESRLLLGSERERQRTPVAIDQLARLVKHRRDGAFALARPPRDPDLSVRRLVEDARRRRAVSASPRSRGRCKATSASARGERLRDGDGRGQRPGRPRISGMTASTSSRSFRGGTSSLAGYTGARKSAVADTVPTSYERTWKSRPRRRLPRRRISVPGFSRSASQGWLNQTASIRPDSSATVAFWTLSRRAVRRVEQRTTLPAIVTSSSPKTSAIRRSGHRILVAARPVRHEVGDRRESSFEPNGAAGWGRRRGATKGALEPARRHERARRRPRRGPVDGREPRHAIPAAALDD